MCSSGDAVCERVSVDNLSLPSDLIATLFSFPAPTPSHIHHHRGLSCHSSLTPDLSPRPRLGGCCYGNTAAPQPVTADPWSPNGDHNLLPPASLSMNITEKGEMKNKPKRGRVQRIGGLIDGGMDRWMTEQRGDACVGEGTSFCNEF